MNSRVTITCHPISHRSRASRSSGSPLRRQRPDHDADPVPPSSRRPASFLGWPTDRLGVCVILAALLRGHRKGFARQLPVQQFSGIFVHDLLDRCRRRRSIESLTCLTFFETRAGILLWLT